MKAAYSMKIKELYRELKYITDKFTNTKLTYNYSGRLKLRFGRFLAERGLRVGHSKFIQDVVTYDTIAGSIRIGTPHKGCAYNETLDDLDYIDTNSELYRTLVFPRFREKFKGLPKLEKSVFEDLIFCIETRSPRYPAACIRFDSYFGSMYNCGNVTSALVGYLKASDIKCWWEGRHGKYGRTDV